MAVEDITTVTEVDAVIDALVSPTSSEVFRATRKYGAISVAASAIRRVLAGGDDGSLPGAAIVRGPFSFAFDTPNLNDGVSFYTPTVGDILFDIWWEITVPFDGTAPHADVGTFVDVSSGIWAISSISIPNGLDLTVAGNEGGGTGVFFASNVFAVGASSLSEAFSMSGDQGISIFPGRFTATNPLKIVVSQNGEIGGTAVGGSAGAGNIYIVTGTPVAFA